MKVFNYCEKICGSFEITRDRTNHRFVLSNGEEVICNDILEWWHFTDDNEFIFILNDEDLIQLSLKTLSGKVIIKANEFSNMNQKGSMILKRLLQSDLSSQKKLFLGRDNVLYIFRDIISHTWSLNVCSPMSNFRSIKRSITEYYLFEIDDTFFGTFTSDNSFTVLEFKDFYVRKLLTISFKDEMSFLSADLKFGDSIYTLTKEEIVPSNDSDKCTTLNKFITERNEDGETLFNIYNDERLLSSYSMNNNS